ncbi:MAG: hypothetical protein RLZZ258_537 [Actinomycetota bacterium]|jgi:uncharacterized membrane protein YhaH (DUF805 family)|uniref:DUF805 domain-containing protein n=1 Tax=Rhodoluna sp. TaxID=1969481 RepID=UPI0025EDAB2C|nr:DUF805 domain-containing protein [Rhodoluna sp.]
MSFGDAIKSFFKNYANFNGRARRSEYWFATLFVVLVSIPLSAIGTDFEHMTYGPLYTIWTIAILLPSLAIAVRRLHDVGKPGTWLLFMLVPIIGGIILLVQYVTDSQPGENQFGPATK